MIIIKRQYLWAKLSPICMHLLPLEISIFLGQVLCSREISGTSSIRNVAQPNLYTKLSMVFLHLYLLSLPCFLKMYLIAALILEEAHIIEIMITMDWKSIFLGVFFFGKMLHLSFPECNLTIATQN